MVMRLWVQLARCDLTESVAPHLGFQSPTAHPAPALMTAYCCLSMARQVHNGHPSAPCSSTVTMLGLCSLAMLAWPTAMPLEELSLPIRLDHHILRDEPCL